MAADLLARIEVRKKAIEAENKIDEYADEKKTEKEATVFKNLSEKIEGKKLSFRN